MVVAMRVDARMERIAENFMALIEFAVEGGVMTAEGHVSLSILASGYVSGNPT
jgi:hypothetical protein